MYRLKRRNAISNSGLALTSILLSPGVLASIQGCQADVREGKLWALDDSQLRLVSTLADTILPKTGTPAASEVGVPACIDLLLHNVFEPKIVADFIQGLAHFDEECLAETGEAFLALSPSHRHDLLKTWDEKATTTSGSDKTSFYQIFKRLCIEVYFTTEEGIKGNLVYNPVPGGYRGDVQLEPGDRIEVGNEM